VIGILMDLDKLFKNSVSYNIFCFINRDDTSSEIFFIYDDGETEFLKL